MPAKEIVIDGVTYIRKPKVRTFKAGQWVRVYSKAASGSDGNNGPKAGDWGRVYSVGSIQVTVDFGVLAGTIKTWKFQLTGGDKRLSYNPSVSLLRHAKATS
tara:strand:- start:1324 stop:1629 length:306 start_codon:yes stop_codon:yes gene_type:complete